MMHIIHVMLHGMHQDVPSQAACGHDPELVGLERWLYMCVFAGAYAGNGS